MEKPRYRRHQNAAGQGGDSPRLLRSKSGGTGAPASSKHSKSEENSVNKIKKKQKEVIDGGSGEGRFIMFLPRSMSKMEVPRRTRSGSTSPSAWALSPGRSSPACASPSPTALAPVPKPPASYEKLKKQETRGVGGVLKYFRQKKVSPLLEEEYHQFRVMYNRLLQWRFSNARAEASMAVVKRVAEEKVLSRWVRISVMRKLAVEKKSEIEKQKQEMKLYAILKSEMGMLNEWRRIEAKNVEAVGRVVRKLSAISHCLPLLENAKADIMSVHDVISTATGVMDNIKAMILEMHSQVERTCFLLTELSVMLKQHTQFSQELDNRVTLVASLEAEEKSLRVHHIQLVKGNVNGNADLIHLSCTV